MTEQSELETTLTTVAHAITHSVLGELQITSEGKDGVITVVEVRWNKHSAKDKSPTVWAKLKKTMGFV